VDPDGLAGFIFDVQLEQLTDDLKRQEPPHNEQERCNHGDAECGSLDRGAQSLSNVILH
jgi:hypothetical protein